MVTTDNDWLPVLSPTKNLNVSRYTRTRHKQFLDKFEFNFKSLFQNFMAQFDI